MHCLFYSDFSSSHASITTVMKNTLSSSNSKRYPCKGSVLNIPLTINPHIKKIPTITSLLIPQFSSICSDFSRSPLKVVLVFIVFLVLSRRQSLLDLICKTDRQYFDYFYFTTLQIGITKGLLTKYVCKLRVFRCF